MTEPTHEIRYQFAFHFGLSASIVLTLHGPSELMETPEITDEDRLNLLRRIVVQSSLLHVSGPVEVRE